MIITRLYGGLGNQMFQYALGRQLALSRGTDFYIDTSAFERYKLHKYNLDKFCILENIAKKKFIPRDINRNFYIRNYNLLFNKIFRKVLIIEEKEMGYSPNILQSLDSNVYLMGYWQSELYFNNIRNILLDEFTLKKDLREQSMKIFEKISVSNSVSLHVRRGDYVSNSNTMKTHGVCSLNYYNQAIQLLKDKYMDLTYFIFSDDKTWVKENLKITGKTYYVDHNDAEHNYEDLFLMSSCKHNVIANSSFSWWGAWLNKNQNKIIIAPKMWFNNPEKNSKDIIPSGWLKM